MIVAWTGLLAEFNMNGALRGALIGGGIGLVAGLIIWLVRKGAGGDKS